MTHGVLLDLRVVQVTPGAVEGRTLGSGVVVPWGDVEVILVPTQIEYQTCWWCAKQAMGSGIWEEMPGLETLLGAMGL